MASTGLPRHVAEIWNILVTTLAMVCGARCGHDHRKSWIWFYFPDLWDTAPSSVTCRRHTCFKKLAFFISSSQTWSKSMLGVILAPKSSQTNVVCLQAIAKVNENIFFWCWIFCNTPFEESFRSCRRPLQIRWNLALKIFFVVQSCRCCSKMYQKVTVCYTRRALLLLLSVLVARSLASTAATAATAARTSL